MTSSTSGGDARLKVHLARLHLEREEREREYQFRRELELKKLEAESTRVLELKKLEAETAIRMCELELRSAQFPAAVAGTVLSGSNATGNFDVSKHISLVPVFRETDIECYFTAFERIAVALSWPKDVWVILLQCKLSGKAQEACSSLSVQDSLSYEKVKNAILRVYELVPEGYRQRFRALRKGVGQTYINFAIDQGILFDRWCAACKADDFSSVRELMLLEAFKNCVSEKIVVYLNEQKVTTLQQAATLADEFALTHKNTSVRHYSFSYDDTVKKPSNTQSIRVSSGAQGDKRCFFLSKT